MPRKFDNDSINLEIDDSVNEVFDEAPGSNSFLALRRLRWSEKGNFKLDIRKWYTNSEGEEVAGKGVSFLTEDGPNNLINALMKHGYGDTRGIIDSISTRDDFLPNVKRVLNKMEVSSLDDIETGEGSLEELYFDPKNIFSGE